VSLCACALAGAASTHAQTATRVVDRAFVCATEATGDGKRDLDVDAHPHVVYTYPGLPVEAVPAFLSVSSGSNSLDSDLVAIRARPLRGISRTLPAGVYAHARRCSRTRTTVPLSATGLEGPLQWAKRISCSVPGRVLVHVRAVLAEPTGWEQHGAYVGARRPVASAKVAIRAAGTRKPIAYLELAAGLKTRFWYGRLCA
jgi:hypothetical protein